MDKIQLEFNEDELVYLGGALTFICAWITDDKAMGLMAASACRVALLKLGDKGAAALVNRVTDAVRKTYTKDMQ